MRRTGHEIRKSRVIVVCSSCSSQSGLFSIYMTTGISSSSVGTIQFLKTIRKTVRKSYSQSRAWRDDNSFTIVLSQTIILDSVTFIPSSERL